jgi:tetratricopeptide (TPR) repeat protein
MDEQDHAIAANPRHATAYDNRGLLRSRKGDNKGALADFVKTTGIDTADNDMLRHRGEAHAALNQLDLALKDFDVLLRRNPKDSDGLADRADLEVRLKRFDTALIDCRNAIKLDRKSAAAWLACGRAHAGQAHWQEALDDFDAALDRDDTLADAYAERARVKQELGDKAGARADLARAKKAG